MDFGRLSNVDRVNFRLPADDPATSRLLRSCPPRIGAPQVFIGTPQWGERGFLGKIYPLGTPTSGYLYHYARQFETIELNTTYYGVQPTSVEKWRQQVPEGFRFCPKFPGRITHEKRLHDCDRDAAEFLDAMTHFEAHLGPCWLLLPSDLDVDALPLLEQSLRRWGTQQDTQAQATQHQLAVELRHPSWFRGRDKAQTFEALERSHTIAIITDVAGRRDVLHQRLTTETAIVRFVGNRHHPSDFERIRQWAGRLETWFEQGLHQAYLWLHQPEEHLNLEVAEALLEALPDEVVVKPIQRIRTEAQGELF